MSTRSLPSPAALERTVSALERKHMTRLLICTVEAWALHEEPTLPARMAQIRALVDLCVVDRAWARLRPLLDGTPPPEAYLLGAQLLTAQGRNDEAGKLLTRGVRHHPQDDDLRRHLARQDQAQTELDLTAPTATHVRGLVRLAERQLLEGEHVRARQTLERVLAQEPDHPRASDLRWALAGDYALRGVRLQDLARVHAAGVDPIDDHLEQTDTDNEDQEKTEAVTAPMVVPDEAIRSGGFPSLFRDLEPPTDIGQTGDEPPERTRFAVDRYQDRTALRRVTQDEHQHTQIERVVRRPAPAGEDGVDTQVDSPEGTEPPAVDGEVEDEDVIVRRPAHQELQLERTEIYRPLVLDPSRERLPAGAHHVDEGSSFLAPRDAAPRSPRRRRADPDNVDRPTRADPAAVASRIERSRTKPPPAVTSGGLPISTRPLPAAPPPETTQPGPPTPLDLEPASLPPPLTDEYDLRDYHPRAVVPWTGWLLLGMLIGASVLAVIALVLTARMLFA